MGRGMEREQKCPTVESVKAGCMGHLIHWECCWGGHLLLSPTPPLPPHPIVAPPTSLRVQLLQTPVHFLAPQWEPSVLPFHEYLTHPSFPFQLLSSALTLHYERIPPLTPQNIPIPPLPPPRASPAYLASLSRTSLALTLTTSTTSSPFSSSANPRILPSSSSIAAVVGAGPAGLAFATVAARRGHSVSLFDASPRIGGQFNLAKRVPGKEEFYETLRYFGEEIKEVGVKLHLSTKVDATQLEQGGFDKVGGTALTPRKRAHRKSLPRSPSTTFLLFPDATTSLPPSLSPARPPARSLARSLAQPPARPHGCPPFLPYYLPSYLPTFLPACLPTFLPTHPPSFLPSSIPPSIPLPECPPDPRAPCLIS